MTGSIMNSVRKSFSGFGRELIERIREDNYARLDEAALEEKIIGIERAISALREVGVEEGKIIDLLQKYWDLRLSEAIGFCKQERCAIEDK